METGDARGDHYMCGIFNVSEEWLRPLRVLSIESNTHLIYRSIASSAIAPAVPQILKEFHSDNQEIGTLIVTIEVRVLQTCSEYPNI